jgi:hypothetical protein
MDWMMAEDSLSAKLGSIKNKHEQPSCCCCWHDSSSHDGSEQHSDRKFAIYIDVRVLDAVSICKL